MSDRDRLERTVHGRTADGHEIVRLDKSGKWWIENPADRTQRRMVSVGEAATLAADGTVFDNRYGGTIFNHKVRAIRASR